ncbi:hypothetical protein NDU88_001791 [Pleurodeles waltl]|uniref:Uncharacterized protein n=1 Tax=Pleurodeles waltl TaxID=8319 RepID=A0AAV7NDK0_PLEWA|nr:hypothetical protein NDU88_001791 [Pleurodeles waltl]
MSESPWVTLSRRQKRAERQQYVQNPNTVTRPSPGVASKVCTVSGDFRQSQRNDPSLKNAWQQALNPEEHAHTRVGGHELVRKKARERVRGSKGKEIKAAQQEPGLRKERENEVKILQGQYNRERRENTREKEQRKTKKQPFQNRKEKENHR